MSSHLSGNKDRTMLTKEEKGIVSKRWVMVISPQIYKALHSFPGSSIHIMSFSPSKALWDFAKDDKFLTQFYGWAN